MITLFELPKAKTTNLPVFNAASGNDLLPHLRELNIAVADTDPRLDVLLTRLKEMADEGYNFAIAPETADIEALRVFDQCRYFTAPSYRSFTEKRYNANGDLIVSAEVTAKSKINGDEFSHVADSERGNVDAYNQTIHKILADGGYRDAKIVNLESYFVYSLPRKRKPDLTITIGEQIIQEQKAQYRGSDTGVPTCVTMSFSTLAKGEQRDYTIQHIHPNVIEASINTINKGIELGLRYQGIHCQ